MKNKKSISAPKKGMNRSTHGSQQQNIEYSFALNANSHNEVGEDLNIQNESSNYLGVNFPLNYKVIGHREAINKERTYYILTNPNTKKSSIGFVNNIINERINNEAENDCEDCNYVNTLGTPLENTVQTPSLSYVELINDNCHIDAGREGLNLDINFPAKKIEIKEEKLGTTIYWNDNRNSKRYLNVADLEERPTDNYLFRKETPCKEDEIVDCIIIDKLLVFPKHSYLQLEPELIQTGGNLKLGTYEFRVAYCDVLGNEMTQYSTPTNPLSVFDENVLVQTELDVYTNFAIKIKVKNLNSKNFKYYKVVCIERNNVNNTQSPFVEGIHPTTDDTILYTHSNSSDDSLYVTTGNISVKKRIDLNTLNAIKPTYERAKGTMVSGDVMWDYGLHKKEELNLQPVVNLFSGLSQWITSAAKQDLYKSTIATSRYKGYMRNEVQPFSIRFYTKDGDYTANFPFIGRPANDRDNETVSDKNYQSIDANTPKCGVNSRNKKWQIFNTATVTSSCSPIDTSNIITEDVNKSCQIKDVFEIPANEVILNIEDRYSTLAEYIADKPETDISGITDYLEAVYPQHCTPPFSENCSDITLTSEVNKIARVLTSVTTIEKSEEYFIQEVSLGDDFEDVGFKVVNEPFTATKNKVWTNGTLVYRLGTDDTFIEKEIGEYLPSVPPEFCNVYKRNSTDGKYDQDTSFMENYMRCENDIRKIVYKRDSQFNNEVCGYAPEVLDNNEGGMPIFLNYAGSLILDDLKTTKDVDPSTITSDFADKLHVKAQFFKIQKNSRKEIIFEITKTSDCVSDKDQLPIVNKLRYTLYKSCNDFTVLGGGIVDTTLGKIVKIDTSAFTSPSFIVAIDSPVMAEIIQDVCFFDTDTHMAYKIIPPCGCFYMTTKDVEFKQVKVSWDKIILDKVETYTSSCEFSLPKVNECNLEPYAKGDFAYVESTEEYPDNKQLYDSSKLKIKNSDLVLLNNYEKEKFKEYYTENGSVDEFGNYILKVSTNFTCQPIRHFKFPDNTIAPFMYDSQSTLDYAETIIFPIGLNINSTVVRTMLQVAVVNGYITQKDFENIEGYEILRGDNSIHKSVIANGLAFDMYNYDKEDGEKWWYPNFPFNDLGNDKFHTSDEARRNLIKHPNQGNSNHMFSFLSPDIFLTKPTIPTEVVLAGYQFGNASQSIVDVEKHPKYTILGRDARRLATDLAKLEVVLELAIKVGELTAQQFFTVGVSTGASFGLVGAALATAAYGVGSYTKIGEYRYNWLKIFEDLGTSYNFAAMTVGVGTYNKFLKADSENNNYLRRLTIRKYIRDGMFNTVDTGDNNRININNWQREDSVLLSTSSNYKIEYDNEYKIKDNNVLNSNSSKIISSDVNCKTNLNSLRDVASPYFSLKNYIPDQWGTVDSIKWLTTNSIFKIREDTECENILGGTVCISPFSWRRKTPIFRSTAMGTADKLPFNYSDYNNIGYSRYYIDYKVAGSYTTPIIKIPFPDINSDYKFDCQTGDRDFYVKPPSKLYLYSHGVVDFLVESEINCHFRYARKEPKDWFYPQVTNVADWVQEVNLPMSEPNTFFYNNTYSFPVSSTPYKFLDYTYDKEVWRKRNEQPNAVIYSEIDNNENSITDPWLVYKPTNWYEFSSKFGKLIDLKDIESGQFLARFENQLVLHNTVDNLAERITPENLNTGTAGIFAKRPSEFKTTDLGFAGTQNTDICSTPYGHFWVDAKRGRVFQTDQNGKDLQVVSEQIGNQPSNMKQWFREQLPFKILKKFPQVDIDNKFKGLGMNIYYDDRFSRVFFTKRDYVVKDTPCLKYDDEIGFYNDCEEYEATCPEGFTYNELTNICERVTTTPLCPNGYVYNSISQTCTLTEVEEADCECFVNVTATPSTQTVETGSNMLINLSSNEEDATFSWTVTSNGVTGYSDGSGSVINQQLSNANYEAKTATYTITPSFGDCIPIPTVVTITVTNPPPYLEFLQERSEIAATGVTTDFTQLTPQEVKCYLDNVYFNPTATENSISGRGYYHYQSPLSVGQQLYTQNGMSYISGTHIRTDSTGYSSSFFTVFILASGVVTEIISMSSLEAC